jgi:hypothetical protein
MNRHSITSQATGPIPPDDLQRDLKVARPQSDATLRHIGLVGVSVSTRTTSAPKLDAAAQVAFGAKAVALAPKYRTELLGP